MKKFTIPCNFGESKAPFAIYVGSPADDNHPLLFQNWWLIEERGGNIPKEVMDSFEKLHKIAKDNDVDFEELCMYALGSAAEEKVEESKEMQKKAAEQRGENQLDQHIFRILADPEKLNKYFEEAFSLIFFTRNNKYNELCHALLLLRQQSLENFKEQWNTESVLMEQLLAHGFTEYYGIGTQFSEGAYRQLISKYYPERTGRIFSILELLKKEDFEIDQTINQAFSEEPKDPAIQHKFLAIEQLKKVHRSKAEEKLFSMLIAENSADHLTFLHRARARFVIGKYREALEDYDQSIELEPEAVAFADRGWCKLVLNYHEGALSDMERAIKISPQDPYLYRCLSQYHLENGNMVQALYTLLRARALGYQEEYGPEVDLLIEQVLDREIIF